jgi:hypothetical protein
VGWADLLESLFMARIVLGRGQVRDHN